MILVSPKKESLRHKTGLDDPRTTAFRKSHLSRAGYLRCLYQDWYRAILRQMPARSGEILELGSGGGFFREMLPGLITSDVLPVPGVDRQIDACHLPFADQSLRAIVGTNVLHHFPDLRAFFREAQRTLADGGRMIFIEPWPTPLSRPIYRYLHHEPFEEGRDWSLPPGGPLTSANGALPWIALERDRPDFQRAFPFLRIRRIRPLMPVSYLVSGGIERAWPVPAWIFSVIRFLEKPLDSFGLFALLVVEKEKSL